jgi:hypothetical protein
LTLNFVQFFFKYLSRNNKFLSLKTILKEKKSCKTFNSGKKYFFMDFFVILCLAFNEFKQFLIFFQSTKNGQILGADMGTGVIGRVCVRNRGNPPPSQNFIYTLKTMFVT